MNELTFYHSGNCGDIISSLPFCIYYNKEVGKTQKFNFTCIINAPASYCKKDMIAPHPCGSFTLTKHMYDMFAPLLNKQPYINEVNYITHGTWIPNENKSLIKLDEMRKHEDLSKVNLTRSYLRLYPLKEDLHDDLPWLFAGHDDTFADKIVLSHSLRYIPKSSLTKLVPYQDRIIFIGVPEEYAYAKRYIPNIIHQKVKDFYETACIINSCFLFISNQTMNWWIAEGLKAPRFILRFDNAPNCVPLGRNGYTIFNSEYFEKMLKQKLGY